MQSVWVKKDNFRETRIVQSDAPTLADGEILLEVDKFALTANNVSYAVIGDSFGYWRFFPTGEEGWGIVPVWGFATVVESRADDVPVGERIYGYLPFASHLVLTPAEVSPQGFVDVSSHRTELPVLYNQYARTSLEPEALAALEDARCVFFPLFVTGYLLADYLLDNTYLGADQIVIGSASSKTGFGLAAMLNRNGAAPRVVGLTSLRNAGFVKNLSWYDDAIPYEDIERLDADMKTVFVDMSGHGPARSRLHHHYKDNLVQSCMVGGTHWESESGGGDLPGARPKLFFAPSQIEKRDQEWGQGVLLEKAYAASAEVAADVKNSITIQRFSGPEQAAQTWKDLVDNRIAPSVGLIGAIGGASAVS